MTDVAARMRSFYAVLANTLVANVTTSYLWFALTFWAYLETRSVLATAIIGGSYMLLVAVFGVVFGTIVDHMKKKAVMLLSSMITLVSYLLAGALFLAMPESTLIDWGRPWFWLFAGVILIGGVVENMRNIALSTTVTLLVPAERRDRANGLVGTVQGIAFMVTSVFSGLSVGLLGMGPTVLIAIVMTAAALVHLLAIPIPEEGVAASRDAGDAEAAEPRFSLRRIVATITSVPGLMALIMFNTFNNLVGGVFMALMDPYGLTLFSVELWGIVLGVTSLGFVIGGGVVAAKGLGKNPVRTLLLVNLGVGLLGLTFAIREWWWLYAGGMLIFMALMPVAEAAEQTILQRVVPFRTQGRVFGFAASVEAAASPISAFLVGPIAEFWLIPYMRSDAGRGALGWLLGDGEARGIALAFIVASMVMLLAVGLAFVSKPYRLLSETYASTPPPEPAEAHGVDAEVPGAQASGAASSAATAATANADRSSSETSRVE